MERILIRMLFVSCLAAAPFILKRKNLPMYLTIFFAKGILSSAVDSIFIKRNKIEYPVRPFPKIFDTNILYDLLFYPLLSVVWVRWTDRSKPLGMILKSLCFSVPMSVAQWIMEKRTKLFKWRSWSVLQTFAYINFTLFAIRALAGGVRKLTKKNKPTREKLDMYRSNRLTMPSRIKNIVMQPSAAKMNIPLRPVQEPSIDSESADLIH
ncbi:CBO0543 family protein [Paenibacillus allorhizosphaerae]|uniref:Spore cortex biosynthesis protein YabQ n=1 Tax=Paenibacillus allorhizosphaerae TaxID=2849866 RepID=A0ABN7TU87_9BACL|nr:CBO0543 family protein [Paenibacillus allorhizosphaerae]CAG7650165.1 hypothetical protein PAECIP111802_04655 [Paenibacillus allorhizosphaerae]